jgi:hypothetical protein
MVGHGHDGFVSGLSGGDTLPRALSCYQSNSASKESSALCFGSLPTATSAQQIDRGTQLKQRIL